MILKRSTKALLYLAGLPLLLCSTTLLAQTFANGGPLVEPIELCPVNGVLDVSLDVKYATGVPIQVLDKTNTIVTQNMDLRAFHLVDNAGKKWRTCDPKAIARFDTALVPGLTFRLRKGTKGNTNGDRFSLSLRNLLPATTKDAAMKCNPVYRFDQKPPSDNYQCSIAQFATLEQTAPNCFHGSNVTNFHYHGFHISPQAHQDFVLLKLFPKDSTGVIEDELNAVGQYRYDLDPIPQDQAEGTHWYHPHKHGSTSLQVQNGMAGTFILEGPFDDWLNGQYAGAGGLEDKVLVVQQIYSDENFFRASPPVNIKAVSKADNKKDCNRNLAASECVCVASNEFPTPQSSVNGQINPVISMKSGEVQRWRFIGATMQASAQLTIGFDASFQIKQIAQDGVQFVAANYEQQPLLDRHWFVPGKAKEVLTNFNLAPGNRADFLVQAPQVSQRKCFVHKQDVFGSLSDDAREKVNLNQQALIKSTNSTLSKPPLVTVCVEPEPKPMAFPLVTDWPATPGFLKNIVMNKPYEVNVVDFSMEGTSAGVITNKFTIDNEEYCPTCVSQTMTLDKPVEWRVTNDSSPLHPFHIHVNPFQLLEQGSIISGTPTPFELYDPPIWQDTIALPKIGSCWDLSAGPIWNNNDAKAKCEATCADKGTTWNGNWVTTEPDTESVCSCCVSSDSPGYVTLRQQPTNYTGEFVLHCHILGHEDRGMMQNVQTVCSNGQFGNPQVGSPECVQGNYENSKIRCDKDNYCQTAKKGK